MRAIIFVLSCLVYTTQQQLRVSNGHAAILGEIPYQVALFTNGNFFCGGALINTSWVVTAGHCCQSKSNISVYLGYLGKSYAPSQTISNIGLSNIFIHPNMNRINATGDICLLKLPIAAQISDNVRPLKYANASEITYLGDRVQISGYAIGDALEYASTLIILPYVCGQTYGPKVSHPDQHICTHSQYKNSVCAGDSGGPLVHRKYGIIGIVSYSKSNSCNTDYPNVFTRISYYYNWIENTIKNN